MVFITTSISAVEFSPKTTWPMLKLRCAKSLQQTSRLCGPKFLWLRHSHFLVNNRTNARSSNASPEVPLMAPTVPRSVALGTQSAFIATPTSSSTCVSDLMFQAPAGSDTSNCKRCHRRTGVATKKVRCYNAFTELLGKAKQHLKNISIALKKPNDATIAV